MPSKATAGASWEPIPCEIAKPPVSSTMPAGVIPVFRYHKEVRAVKGKGRIALVVWPLQDDKARRIEHPTRRRDSCAVDVRVVAVAVVFPRDEEVCTIEANCDVALFVRCPRNGDV